MSENKKKKTLKLENISAKIGDKEILKEISFTLEKGKTLALFGPNGAGKSTIGSLIMGNPNVKLTKGNISLAEQNLNSMSTDERARLGLFMSFQHPIELAGVPLLNVLKASYKSVKGKEPRPAEFRKLLNEKLEDLGLESSFRNRALNHGFSGGEKKRSELLQMMLLEPDFAILDEIDSGMDIDGLKRVVSILNKEQKKNNTGYLVITHNTRFLSLLNADEVVVIERGKITRKGNKDLIKEIEEKGFNLKDKAS